MPGVYRPQNLVDVINVLTGQSTETADTTTSGLGYFAEADETVTCQDSAATLVGTALGWDQAQWSCLAWG